MPGESGRLGSTSKPCNSRVAIVSELRVERWENLFRIVRQRAKALQRVKRKKKLGWVYISEWIPKYLIQHRHRWPQPHHSEHTQALLSKDTHGLPCSPTTAQHSYTHCIDWYMLNLPEKKQLFYRLFPYFSPLPSCSPGTSISISLEAVFNMPAESINWWTHNKESVCKPAKQQIYESVELKNHVSLCSPMTFPCKQKFCIQAGTTSNQTSTRG